MPSEDVAAVDHDQARGVLADHHPPAALVAGEHDVGLRATLVGHRMDVVHGPDRSPGRRLRSVPWPAVAIRYEWRGEFTTVEVNQLHAEAFETRVFDESEWDWHSLTAAHSLGWVVARDSDVLIGFVNVLWDGLVHAWVQDTMVVAQARGRGIGTELVAHAIEGARAAGCEWLHVDFDDDLRHFYFDSCGFRPTNAGLIALQQ